MPRGVVSARRGRGATAAKTATTANDTRRRRNERARTERKRKAESPDTDRGTTRSGKSFSAERKAYYDSYSELVRIHPKTFSTAASLYTVGRKMSFAPAITLG